jgi:hypothetical protein
VDLIFSLLFFFALPSFTQSKVLDHTRIIYGNAHYAETLQILKGHESIEALWLKAESLFRLGKFKEALIIYDILIKKDKKQAQKSYLRILESHIQLANITDLSKLYENYKNTYKYIPDNINYALGKLFFDRGYEKKAHEILSIINNKSIFGMRALYILGALTNEAQHFELIAQSAPQCVEDYTIKAMALMALARLKAFERDYEEARVAYERVPLESAYGAQAAAELIELMIFWAESLEPQYPFLAQKALRYAEEALGRYRTFKEPDVSDNALYLQMGRLLAKTKRYDDGRALFTRLENYYNNINNNLVNNFEVLKNIKEEIFKLQEKTRKLDKLLDTNLYKKITENEKIVRAYYDELLLLMQPRMERVIKDLLARMSYERAELLRLQLEDINTKMQAVGRFKSEKIMNFEKNINTIGSSL